MNSCSICIAKSRRKFTYIKKLFFNFSFEIKIKSFAFNPNSIEDDDKIERELENVDITAKDKCVIQ